MAFKSGKLAIQEFEHQAVDGHMGEVLAVDASDGMDYVLSGGEDCTTRVWKYYDDDYACYRLHHVSDHCRCHDCAGFLSEVAAISKAKIECVVCAKEYKLHPEGHEMRPAVTSVALWGSEGPAISATRSGTLHVMDVNGDKHARFQVFQKSITKLRVKRGHSYRSENAGALLITLCCDTEAGAYEIYPEGDSYKYLQKASFPHDDAVTHAEHMPGNADQGAVVVTSTKKCITLWSMKGEVVYKVTMGNREFACIRISRPNNGWSWMAASVYDPNAAQGVETQNTVAFWPIVYGNVIGGIARKEWPMEYSSGIKQKVHDFTISPNNAYIMLQYLKGSDFVQFAPLDGKVNDEPISDPADIVSIDGCPNQILKERDINYLISVPHKYHCNEMQMRIDDGDGTDNLVAVLAFEDGSVGIWDLQGSDAGQQTADMRSMTTIEILMPVVMRFLTFAQVITFAFGPSTFSPNVQKPIAAPTKIASFDPSLVKHYMPSISLSDLFLPEFYTALGIAVAYLFFVLTGTPENLAEIRNQIGHSRSFDKGPCWMCKHMQAYSVSISRSIVTVLLGACSTVLVVPMFKVFTKILDCVIDDDGETKYLRANPDIICYEPTHWKLVGACAVILPLYFAMLLPYAVVAGDSTFVNRETLFSPDSWSLHAERQATLIYQGAMHPKSENVYKVRAFELLIKILMPCIVILTSDRPHLQTLLVFACGLAQYIVALKYIPLVDRVMNSFVQGGQLFTAACMFCGFLTVALPMTKHYSVVMLATSLVLSIIWSYCATPPAQNKVGATPSKDSDGYGYDVLPQTTPSNTPQSSLANGA